MAFISYEEYKQRRTNGESASSIVRESFGNQSTAGQGFPDFEEYQRLRNSGQSARDIVSQYLQPKQETQKITRHDTEAPVTRRASSAPIIPEIEQRRQSEREAAGTARDQASKTLQELRGEKDRLTGNITDEYTAAMYADKIAELDRQIAEASKNYKAKDQEYKDVYAGYNAARKELRQAEYDYSQALSEYGGKNYEQNVKDAETRLANARRAFDEQGGNPDASVVSAGLKGSAAGVVDTFGYLQELGQPENEKSWGIFTTGHMTEAQKHHQEVLAQREKEKYEAEHGAGTYTETPVYLRTQDAAAKLTRESAEEINSMKAGRGEIGQIAVDLGAQGVQMGADAIAGKVLPGGSLTAMALRTFGSSVREARDEGANIYQQGLYGAGSAAVEVLTEKMFDGLAGVYGAGAADDIVSHMIGKITDNRLGQAALEWAADALGEGLEEVASDAVNPLLQTIYNDMSVGESYRENLDWQEVGYDFLIGALMGFAGGSVENVANITGVTAPDERADFFMQAGQSGMSFKDAMNTWHKHMIKEGYATQTSDQEITNQANEYLNRLESGKRVSERKINKLNQRATNTIAQEDIANTVTGVQQRMQQFGINDPKLAQAIAAVALENEAERIGAKGVGATEAQRKMVEDSSIAKRILSEMDVENMRREQAADYFNRFAEMGGASDEELQRNIEPYQRTNEWVKNLKGNKALASDVYGTQNTVTEAEKNAVTINGESVKIVGAENGKVTIEQNGERQTVDAGKLENMSDSYKQLVSYAPAGQSGEAFLRLYKSSQDVAAYAKAWDLAENMYGAQTNVSFDEARQRSSLKVLTDAQLQMALDIGRDRYNANKAKAEERGKQLKQAREEAKKRGAEQRKKGTVSYDGGEVNGVKYKGIDKSKLSVAQKRVVAMVEALADAVNIDYVLFEGEANTGGSYIQGGTVYINIKAGEYSGKTLGAATLSHELTHFLQDFAPEEYQELKDFLIAEIIKQSPAQFEKLVQKQLMLEPNLNYDRATDEMIANACQKMLLNSEAVTKLARQNMNLAEKIRDAISEISDKIKAAFEDVDMSDNVPVFEAARSIENVMDKAQALWDKALEAASENYNAAQATGMKAEGGVQNMLIGVREDGIEVYETSPEIKRLPWKEKRKKFLDIMSNEYRGRTAKFFRNGHTYYARFEDVDAQKTIFGDNDSDQTGRDAKTNLGADGDIFTLVENAEWFGGEVERGKPGKAHKDVKYWDYYLKTVQIDGRVFDLLVNVRQKVGDSFVYSLELFERKDVKAASPRSFSEEKRSPGVPTASNQIIADESEKSNTEIDAGDTAFEYDAETESVNEQHQLLTWEASDYVTERNKAAKEIADKLGISQKKAKDYIDSVNSVAKYIAENKGRLDYEDTGRSPFVGNVEYGGSFDFTTLCKKRRLLTGTFSAIQQALANTALTANEILEIRKMMDDAGLEVSCGKCYVEGSRASMGIFTKEFLKLYEKYNPGAWVPNMAQMNTPDGIEWVRVNHPEVYEQYEYFWNHYGTLRPGDPNLFASQQKPKLYQMRSAYKGEVLKQFKNDGSIQEKNRNGGLRMQSFSDFEIVHLLDAMQVIMDMSRVGLNGQAYTKVPDFAWALGKTGLKINLSIDAWDVVDGKLVFNNKEGMNFNEAMRIRDANSKNVGTICCVYDDAQLLAALADPRIDFIIPFHRSQWKKSQYKGMGLPATTKDYTYQQNEKWLNPSAHTHEYRGRQVKDKCTNYMPNEYWDFSKSGKENAEEYLRMCARDGKRPKFYKFLTNNGDGSYSLKSDGSTDGYWKLLIDFKMYDNEGNGSPQMPVKPDFNMEEIRRMLESYEGGHNSFPVAHGVVNQFVDKYKAAHPGQQFQKLNADYADAVENNDMDKAAHLVNQAAKDAGAILNKSGRGALHLYHGTPSFGFTEFHPGMIFLTDNPSVAAGYTANKGYGRKRGINEVYTPDDGSTKTLLKNIKNVLGREYREAKASDASDIYETMRTASDEMNDKVNEAWQNEAMDALHDILGDEYTDEFENKLYTILALPGSINENLDYIFENPESDFITGDIRNDLEKWDDYRNDIRPLFVEHHKELMNSAARGIRDLIIGYDLSDYLIDAQYSMLKALDIGNMLVTETGSLVSKDGMREAVEQAKDVGAYDLYGFAGDNQLVIDGKGGFWASIEAPELGTGTFVTDEIGRRAKEKGYTSVLIKNIMDSSMNNFASNVNSDVYIFFDSNQVKSADPVTYDNNGNVIPLEERFNQGKKDIRYQKLSPVEEEAVNHFGTTDNFRTAGYMLRDGRMLDFSGVHWLEGYDDKYIADWRKKNDIRQVDHEDVFEAYEAVGEGFPSDSSLDFMKHGNIRMVPESPGIELYYKSEPTDEQYRQIKAFVREVASDNRHYNSEHFTVDLTRDRTRRAGTLSYTGTINADRVVNDIKHYYQTGEVRRQGLSQFYQKLGIGETAEEQQARKESFDNLKAENKILRARAEYWKAQTRPTKERTVRQQDTDRLARELLKKYESRADRDEVKTAMKALGDWLVQTEELDYDELRTKAEAIAEDIISGNYALLDNSQQENLDRLKDYLKSTPVNLTQADFRDTGDEGFRKKYGRYFTVRENGRTIDSLWGEMAAMFGEGVFPEDVYAPGDMLNMIADYLDMWKPQYGNEFEMFHDEAVNAATNEIIDAILSEDVRQTPGTFADKAQQKLNSQIAKDKEKLDALRAAKNARIEELKRQASEKNAQIRLAEKAAKYEAVSKVKKHYRDMLERQRNKRGDTKLRAKIKKLHKELSDILLKPKEGRYVPRELVKATAEILGAVDTTSGRAVKAKAAMAELKVKYDALAKDQKYALTYDETVSGMLQSLVEELGDGNIYDLTGTQLEAMYNVLKSLKHTIVTANKLVGAKIEADAFEAANEMMHETESAKGIPNKLLRRFALAQMTPSSAFRAFGGYKKNSMWEQMFNELNNGQLTQTQILMEGGQIFRELIDDKKNMAKLHDQKNLVDIGLKDDQGNAIKVTRGMMLSVYMHLLNEQNARHVAYGGLTVPRLKQYYKNQMKDAFNGKTGRAVAFATEIAELNEQLKNAETVEEQEAIKERLAELNDQTDAYMSNLRAQIEEQLTDYDRKWIAAAQEFFDVYSKGKLNEVTEMIYGFEKAQVDNYFPIHTDPDYRAASFDTIVRDMNLENAGFMKERVNGANPILLEDITDVISSQLRRTAQYVGLMPAIRNFNKVYGKARAGYSMSVQSAMARTFESEGKKYIENLMADLNGARKGEPNIFDELRGRMAGAVLTLNPRVTLSQAASFPSAAAEIGYKPLMKALTDMKNPMWDKGLQDEIAKWTPLWWYRMQGFSTTELGDIKNNEQFMNRVMDKMKWATGWIQAADGLTTGGLWQASKYYVDENFTDLKKGSDEYMMKVAEVYNRVLEKTQPDYTTMQRPDILRNPNAIVKQLTMFMTQRLQNTNILYDAAATYSHYLRDAEAGRNGVTAADVKQAKTRLAWAVSSQVAAGATIVIFKAIADAIMHNLKAYRDDDDELTAESVSRTLLTNFIETLSGNILWGSEIFSWTKSAITGERYYGVSLNGVDTFKDVLEDCNKLVQKAINGDADGAMSAGWKLFKAIGQFFGAPLANGEKFYNMTKNYIEDAQNGTWYEAGVDRTRAQNTHLLFNALQSGDGEKATRIRATFKDKKDEQSALKSYIQELYTGKDQKIQKAETIKLLQQYAGMTKREAEDLAQKWTMEVVTGIKFSELQDKYISGEIQRMRAEKYYKDYSSNGRTTEAEAKAKVLEWTCEKETGIAYSDIGTEVKTGRLAKEKAIQMVMKYGGKDKDAATKTVNGYLIEHEYDIKPSELEDEYMAGNVTDREALEILRQYKYYGKENAEQKAEDELERLKFVKANPDAEDISLTQVRNYRAAGLEGIVSASTYAEAAKMMGTFHGVDADNDGKTDRNSIVIQKLEYIDTLDLTPEAKTRLAQALGISEKNIRRRAPWR